MLCFTLASATSPYVSASPLKTFSGGGIGERGVDDAGVSLAHFNVVSIMHIVRLLDSSLSLGLQISYLLSLPLIPTYPLSYKRMRYCAMLHFLISIGGKRLRC
jgi:hypothetical protein